MNLLNEYPQFAARFPASKDWQPIRERGLACLKDRGLPTSSDHFWRFTKLKGLERAVADFVVSADAPPGPNLATSYLESRALPYFRIKDGSATVAPGNSTPLGVTWASLGDVVAGRHPESIRWAGLLQKTAMRRGESFLEALADAHLYRGLLVHVPAGATANIGALFDLSTPEIRHAVSKVFLFVEEGANVSFTEELHVRGKSFFSPSIEIHLAPKASLRHQRIDLRSSASSTYARVVAELATGASYELLSLQSGEGVNHQEVVTHVNGEGAKVALRGLSLGLGSACFENLVAVHHHAPSASSEQFFKSVLAGESRAVFRGEIHIDEGAIHTSSNQLSRALLLGPQTQSITEPVLEIAADDVEAAHGSSTGELSTEELFYLESRGIDRTIAQRLITLGFVLDILETLDDSELKAWARNELSTTQERIFPS